MKAPFGSHALVGNYVPSWKPRARRTHLELPAVVLALARQRDGWFRITDLSDGATGALAVEHYRDKYAQQRVIAGTLARLHVAGKLDRETGPGRRVRYRVRRRRCGACASCLGGGVRACTAWTM